jgi:NTE family protein
MKDSDFIADKEVLETLAGLKQSFANRPLVVSDVTDEKGNQYVDLVQEGGGVLGIALVGYTYVLEQMGIRFFSMAGTSAGSINTMLLACAGNKEDEKSSRIIECIAGLDMFSFVDGQQGSKPFTRFIKKFISNMLMGKKPFKRISNLFRTLLLSLLALTVLSFILNFLWPQVARWVGLTAAIILLLTAIFTWLTISRFRLFAKNGYGLNEGRVFHEWIKQTISSFPILAQQGGKPINNLVDFSTHFMRIPPAMKVRPDDRRVNNQPPMMPLVTIITCDIVAERKIEFTRMWDLYWKDATSVHPGDFVRASMSIPVFFETYSLNNISKNSTLEKWKLHLNWENENGRIPDTVQFIDGGTLSNFPINVFYNPMYPVPRMPTLGIRLKDGITDSAGTGNKTFADYLRSLFSTLRFNYDRDFITKNRAYNLGVKNIDVSEFNWLNFFIKDEDKIRLFRAGVKAAAEFLLTFNWEQYKTERMKNFEMQAEQFENPNNMDVFPYSEVGHKKEESLP